MQDDLSLMAKEYLVREVESSIVQHRVLFEQKHRLEQDILLL